MRETRSTKSPQMTKPAAGLSGAEAAAHDVRKMPAKPSFLTSPMRETRSNKLPKTKSPQRIKPAAGLSGEQAAANEVRKMPGAVRTRGDDLETKRKPKKRNLAEEHSTTPTSPGEPNPEIVFAIFEPDKVQSEAKRDRVCNVVESEAEESSDPPNPPIYEPYISDDLADDPAALVAFKHANKKYKAEKARQADLFTMDHFGHNRPSCLFRDRRLLTIRDPAKDAVLLAAKSVIMLSSFLDNNPLNKCSGLWFQRDDRRKTALVLTSAHLIRVKDPSVKDQGKSQKTGTYHREAKVIIHLLDNTTTPGRLVYLQKHYELALYEVKVDKPVQLPTFNDCVCSGQDVFRLGREENLDLRITHGLVDCRIHSGYERCHYMIFSRDPSTLRVLQDDGGPIIDLQGKVLGLVNNHITETFVPSSILHRCLDFWRKFNCMPRLHLGMTFTSIKLLDPISIERMTRNHNIESGLIVEKVSKQSHAEKIGIRKGDVIETFNGKYISTTFELEKMLVDICWEHFDQGKELNAETDVSVKIFDATKGCWKTRNLTGTVSDSLEVIVKGAYTINSKEAMSASNDS